MLSNVLFYSMFSRHGKAQASLSLLIWLNENVPFHSTFSRHGKAQASLALLIWLNEILLFHGTFSRHGKAQASLALLIWLNENVLLVLLLFVINALFFPSSLLVPYASKLFVMCFLLFCNTYYLHIFSSNRTFASYCQVWVLIKASFRLASNCDSLPIKINNR